ncbi:hypothetical protein GCM10009609_35450 [Pseudonocardia aurantiaca]|uniref:Uncharacterized protein n=1 Tax=Pseudonocardia aurantiaca TaxID=75290 RepID=A0ABW4FNB0_9PSEU
MRAVEGVLAGHPVLAALGVEALPVGAGLPAVPYGDYFGNQSARAEQRLEHGVGEHAAASSWRQWRADL